MLGRPNRRTFLKGLTVAVGVGAAGVLFSKPDVGVASLSVNTKADTTVVIRVWLEEKAGTEKEEWSVLAPGAEASPGYTIIWKPMTDNIRRIQKVQFKESQTAPAWPNPFSKTNAVIPNPDHPDSTKMKKRVLGDADLGTYHYKIHVIGRGEAAGRWASDDPPLDIVPPN